MIDWINSPVSYGLFCFIAALVIIWIIRLDNRAGLAERRFDELVDRLARDAGYEDEEDRLDSIDGH